jgi:hypothetical protein
MSCSHLASASITPRLSGHSGHPPAYSPASAAHPARPLPSRPFTSGEPILLSAPKEKSLLHARLERHDGPSVVRAPSNDAHDARLNVDACVPPYSVEPDGPPHPYSAEPEGPPPAQHGLASMSTASEGTSAARPSSSEPAAITNENWATLVEHCKTSDERMLNIWNDDLNMFLVFVSIFTLQQPYDAESRLGRRVPCGPDSFRHRVVFAPSDRLH